LVPSSVRGEKPQNRPLSKLNTGRLALRAMLPVTNRHYENNGHLVVNQQEKGKKREQAKEIQTAKEKTSRLLMNS